MSGRLIITNKKSYTPWNAKNVERALRDERIQKEKEEKKASTARQERNQERISWMKKQKYNQSNNDNGSQSVLMHGGRDENVQEKYDGSKELCHVNLFQEEEKRCLDDAAATSSTEEMQRGLKRGGIMPVYLVGRENEERIDDLFYKRKDILRKDVDDKLKQRQDPMAAYHTAEKIYRDKCESSGAMKLTSGVLSRSKNSSMRSRIDNGREQIEAFALNQCIKRKAVKDERKRGREEKEESTRRMEELRQRRLKREVLEKDREKGRL